MKLRDLSNISINRKNKQISLNLRSKQLKKIGITPECLLNLKIPKNFQLIKSNKDKREVK